MALEDLKSKLNQFRGENTPNNPYQKSGKRDTDLESNVDIKTNPDRKKLSDTVDGEGRQILGQSISTGASTFLKGLKHGNCFFFFGVIQKDQRKIKKKFGVFFFIFFFCYQCMFLDLTH